MLASDITWAEIDALINASIAWAVGIAIPTHAPNASGRVCFRSTAPLLTPNASGGFYFMPPPLPRFEPNQVRSHPV